jgi:hypothetical protein
MTDIIRDSWDAGSGVPADKPFGTIDVTPEFVAEFAKMTPEQQKELMDVATRNQLAQYYGSFAVFFDVEEIGELLVRAAQQGWDPRKLRAEIMRTEWWAETERAHNQYDAFVATNGGQDSATVQRVISDKAVQIGDVSAQLGMRLSDEQTRKLARDALRNQYDQRTLQQAIAAEIRLSPNAVESLRVGATGRDVRELASDYAVPLSDSTMDKWMNDIMDGRITKDDFENYLRTQAIALYPTLANDISRGVTVRQYGETYRQVAAQTLGLSSEEIDLSDPKWNVALNFDDGKGRRAMNLFEWGEHLRKDERYGYEQTPGARDKAYQMVSDLGRMFGLSA